MTLITVTDGPTFLLGNDVLSYAMRVSEDGLLEHLHFGHPLSAPPQPHTRPLRHCTVMLEDHDGLTLNDLPQEYPTHGRGDFSAPALHLIRAGNSVTDLRYLSHKVVRGKAASGTLPASRGEQAETLIITLEDAVSGVGVDLHYTVWPDHAVIARRSIIRNMGATDINLRHVHSTALDLPPDAYRVQHFHGTWAREFNVETVPLPTGRFVIDSTRGTSSNAHTPYLALLAPDAGETRGMCMGTTLVYSGNHQFSVERGEFGRVRLMAGINPFDFDWTLAPGEAFDTPEALHAVSGSGLQGLSHVWHDFIRANITPERFRDHPRPTYMNTWEAAYFDVSEDKVLGMADVAADLGIEMIVLDDGWFKGRINDRCALGDWSADPDRFPSGIPALAEQVRRKGLRFGLWFEPEMLSPDSDLFRTQPEWAITSPGRKPSLGRHQLTLDLSRPEVVDHIYAQMDAILSSGQINYVKWDMNRNMSDIGSGAKAHRYMLGLYDLLKRLSEAYPKVMFENCASGGNRFDLGMLCFMPQGWISDMCDPVGRLSIINGASHLFPPDVMAAYIGPSPNHQNGRISSLKARYLAGLPCGAHGLSLNRDDIAAHRETLQGYVAQSKASALDRLGARFFRLRNEPNETIWQTLSADGNIVNLIAFQLLNAPNLPHRRICLRGLDPSVRYVLGTGEVFTGDQLMHHGLALSPATGDVYAELFAFRKLD